MVKLSHLEIYVFYLQLSEKNRITTVYSPNNRKGLFQDIQNLYLEYKCRVGRNLIATAAYTVTQFGRNVKDILATFLHQLQTFAETFHYTRRREDCTGIGIELSSVDQRTFVYTLARWLA